MDFFSLLLILTDSQRQITSHLKKKNCWEKLIFTLNSLRIQSNNLYCQSFYKEIYTYMYIRCVSNMRHSRSEANVDEKWSKVREICL